MGNLLRLLSLGDQFLVSPETDCVEILQSQADEIEARVAGGALRFGLMQLD